MSRPIEIKSCAIKKTVVWSTLRRLGRGENESLVICVLRQSGGPFVRAFVDSAIGSTPIAYSSQSR